MASHNEMFVTGYLKGNPKIINEGIVGAEQILFKIQTIRREMDVNDEGKFENVIVRYDGTRMMQEMKALKAFDLIFIKGVVNIVTMNRVSHCSYCGTKNLKYQGTQTFLYPIYLEKKENIEKPFKYQEELPEEILKKHYQEISNQVLIMGNVVSKPQLICSYPSPICRYKLGVDRHYYIKTQEDIIADYPWIYSFGNQALWDEKYLKRADTTIKEKGSLILIDGYMHNRIEETHQKCEGCGLNYSYKITVTDFIPYTVEYLANFKTDADLLAEKELETRLLREG